MAVSDPTARMTIPVDLFVTKKHPSNYKNGDLCFVDSDGNTVFKLDSHRVLLDSAGTPLLSLHRAHKGSWQCFKEDGHGQKEFVLRVVRSKSTLTRTELEVFLAGDDHFEEPTADLKVRGFPFQRSCTIYRGNDIVAQTSLMYKLNQIFVKRGKFRLTIFPGSIDHSWIVALSVIFLHG